MLKPWEWPAAIIGFEVDQRRQEGCEIEAALIERIDAAPTQEDESALRWLLQELPVLRPDAALSFDEPEDLAAIQAARPEGPRQFELPANLDLKDGISGAWPGRAAGCALGKPVAKWPKDTIDAYIKHSDALPLSDYIPAGKGFPASHESQ